MESVCRVSALSSLEPKIKTDRKSLELYIFALAAYGIILYSATIVYKGDFILSTVTLIYWIVATLPLILTKCNWVHPLSYQMIYEITKVLSLACRTSGYAALDFRWHISVTQEECAWSYIYCVFITCMGLLIEYFVVFNSRVAMKKKEIVLTKRRSVNILFIVAVSAFVILVNRLGGLFFIFANYEQRLSEFGVNKSLYLRNFIYYGIIFIFYAYLTGSKKKAFLAAMIQVFMFITLGERGGLISSVILPFFILYQLKKNKCIQVSKIVIGAIGLVFIYMVFGMYRNAASSAPGSFLTQLAKTFSSIEHFVISSELLFLLRSNRAGYLFGKPLLNIFVAPFPRRYFPWKPAYIADSVVVGDIILRGSGRNVFGLPPGMFAYGYLNLGIIGVVLSAVICGLAMKWLYESFVMPFWGKREIPNGNILVYSLLIQYICDVLSTEVQIKLILFGVGIFIVGFLSGKKRRYKRKL